MITVGQLAPGNQWDQTLLDDLFANRLFPTGMEFDRTLGYPHTNGCCLIIPGRYWAGREAEITEALAAYEWVLALRTGDEEDLFDIGKVEHPRIKLWVQTPRVGRNYGDARLFGVGYTPHLSQMPTRPSDKPLDAFLAAQNTHPRRHECFDRLARGKSHKVIETEGFTQGIEPDAYAALMMDVKVAPCPSGPVSPDSFRVWEALQAHAVPIADDITPGYDSAGYWRLLFPDAPFPILTDYADLNGWIGDQVFQWPENANRITAWWMRQKRTYAHWLRDDLEALGAL